jgi:two-component system phosphate regulon sensor histidine kinase PhoR
MKRLWSNRLAFKIFLSFLAVIGLLSVSFYFYAGALIEHLYISSLGTRMEREARVIAANLPLDREGPALDDVVRRLADQLDTRITVIDPDGRVLGDSAESSRAMENHAGRPEVVEAMARGTGSAVRYSTTVGYDFVYRAVLYDYGIYKRVVRLAYPLADIETTTNDLGKAFLLALAVASAIGLLIAYGFSYRLNRRFVRLVEFSRQVAAGSFPHDFFTSTGRDDIAVLETHLNEMSAKLRTDIDQIISEKEKLDSILRCMIEGVLVIDPRGRVATINEQAKRMFGIAADHDVHGASIAELSRHPEMLAMMHEVLDAASNERRYSREIEIDEGRWFRVNAVGLTNDTQEAWGSILVFHDISEIKRLETVRSDFVANVSHELRTPLTAIRGYVETLLRSPPKDPAQLAHFLGVIERNTTRLSRLTEDLLTLSDLESGKIPLARRPVDVGQLAQRVLEVFWDGAEKKQLRLLKHIEPGVPMLLGDFDRLQQLFINLVDNAIKYTPVHGSVTLRAELAAERPGFVDISISDTGVGIPEKDIPRLTERFYRVDRARSRELGGTGLGLAIVKHILQAHDGQMKIESLMHQGTTVHVYLPTAAGKKAGQSILFVSAGNSCRSQMAEGFARQLAVPGQQIYSAGTEPKPIHPLAIEVMKEAGIDISRQHSKSLNEVPLRSADLMITLCSDAAELCPDVPADVTRVHWPLPDPALGRGGEDDLRKIFRDVRDAIRARVEALLNLRFERCA